ncbi:SDR family oxidoreductase [Kitasatospora cheerisanensis]|uniref:Oxidoreductase, short chain dehydrogenase/reductase family protein n=1 Tax=Kitasatospora cheerisanensis KCTC 2395 TaxID=1348663 RepID=A0A066YMA6_9ACTN|nr:SDR family oxidoreductase [Kitasatospora cheerisanensis]KDN81069.1 oxidoreductase, short chain dehydrogenase/reductase family protein [Kitasatospora cheerisanensis KCTC 2395]
MDLGLNGRTALVTGAGRGIGLAVARALAAEGVKVVGATRTATPELSAVAAVATADLSTRQGAEDAVRQALDLLGGIDLLVNNVGAGDPSMFTLGSVLDVDDEQWQSLWELNVMSAVRVTRAALPGLLERRGAIVNVSSINSRIPSGSPVGYAEAKAALTQFGKRLSEELAPRGVRVNTVSPGPTSTDQWTAADGYGSRIAEASGVSLDDLLAGLPTMAGTASGRLSTPEEIADLVLFALSDRAGNLHGADLVMDGGTLKAA